MKASSAIFALFAGCGGFAAGYLVAKKKYIKMCDAEVDSVKTKLEEYYKNPKKFEKKEEPVKVNETEKVVFANGPSCDSINSNMDIPFTDYTKRYTTSGASSKAQTNVEVYDTKNEAIDNAKIDGIYVITPEEFNLSTERCETLFYFADGVLADDDNNEIRLVNMTVGSGTLERFKKYNVDVVYVRNTNLKVDYEICLDERNFADIKSKQLIGD